MPELLIHLSFLIGRNPTELERDVIFTAEDFQSWARILCLIIKLHFRPLEESIALQERYYKQVVQAREEEQLRDRRPTSPVIRATDPAAARTTPPAITARDRAATTPEQQRRRTAAVQTTAKISYQYSHHLV
jgi:hypothetical protein